MLLTAGHHEPASKVRCPICKTTLSEDQYKKAINDMQKTMLYNYKQNHRKESQEYRAKIAELNALHKSQIRSITMEGRNRKKALEEKYREQKRNERKKLREDLKQIRRRYQVQTEQLRTFYSEQTAKLQAELSSEYSSKLLDLTKKYEDLYSNITRKLESIEPNLIIKELESRLKNTLQVAQASMDIEVKEPQLQGSSIASSKREDIEEKRLEVERLKKIQEISEMIKEIATHHQKKSSP